MQKLIALAALAVFIWLAITSYPQEHGYNLSDRKAMDRLVARSIKPHGKFSEAEQYKIATYLWEQ